MKIYTRGGDAGQTSLFGGAKVPKAHPRIESYGTVDELNSWIGVVRSAGVDAVTDAELERIQNDLFDLGAHLASPVGSTQFSGVPAARIEDLETAIDVMEPQLAPLKNFILPGGTPAASWLHVARTVCRRAERHVVALGDPADVTGTTITYLNRLSDFLFVTARYANQSSGVADVEWRKR